LFQGGFVGHGKGFRGPWGHPDEERGRFVSSREGRGKKPRWMTAQLKSGKHIDDFRIDLAAA
jgi:hypothetical protein